MSHETLIFKDRITALEAENRELRGLLGESLKWGIASEAFDASISYDLAVRTRALLAKPEAPE